MIITYKIDHTTENNGAGEALMSLISIKGHRFGYTSHEFSDRLNSVRELKTNIDTDLLYMTLVAGSAAISDAENIQKYYVSEYGFYIYLYWDGDGSIVFHHPKENWLFYNTDMKCSYGWNGLEDIEWALDATTSEGYYEEYDHETLVRCDICFKTYKSYDHGALQGNSCASYYDEQVNGICCAYGSKHDMDLFEVVGKSVKAPVQVICDHCMDSLIKDGKIKPLKSSTYR